MTDTATLFLAVSIPTLASLVGIVWNRIEFSELRSEIRAIGQDIASIRERLARIETGLCLPIPEKKVSSK